MGKKGWYRPALFGAIVIVLLNTWLAAQALHTLLDSQEWLAHTLEVINSTEQLVAQVRTAESAARGYILTASPAFEQQYDDANRSIGDSIRRVQALTGDNPSQQQRIVELRTRVDSKLAVLDEGIAVRHGHPTGMIDPAFLQPVIEDTPDRVESVQASIRAIQAEEQRLLAQRTGNVRVARRQVIISFAIAFFLDFVLLVAAYRWLERIGLRHEQLHTELELRLAQQRFSATFNQAAVGMAHTSTEGRFLLVNQRLAESLDLPIEKLLSLRLWDFLLPSERNVDQELYVEMLAGSRLGYRVERTVLRSDGTTFPAQLTASLLRQDSFSADEPKTTVFWVVEDISARKAAERETADLMTRLINSERLAAAGRMANTLAHEINNPLEALTNIFYLLQDQELSPQSQELIAFAARELDRVGHITRSTLSFYRKVPGRTLDLHTLLDEVVQLFQSRALQQHIEIVTRLSPETRSVQYDPSLRQVFANIVGNALEAMEGSSGHIYVRARLCQKGTVITVSDTGHGIERANLTHVFEPFFTTKGERGTGLGLWVTRGIVEEQGGQLQLRSSTSSRYHGTTIRVTLPSNEAIPHPAREPVLTAGA